MKKVISFLTVLKKTAISGLQKIYQLTDKYIGTKE